MKTETKKPTLRELRKQERWTQKAVAEQTGIAFSTYVAYEMGYRIPKITNAKKLADFYHRKMEDIDFTAGKEE
jgi:transcriptional regulator with XRE-family HTH domain